MYINSSICDSTLLPIILLTLLPITTTSTSTTKFWKVSI